MPASLSFPVKARFGAVALSMLLLAAPSIIAGVSIEARAQADPEPQIVPEPAPGDAPAEDPEATPSRPSFAPEGEMTLTRLDELIRRVDEGARTNGRAWQFEVADVTVVMMTDPFHNRMRLMSPIGPSDELDADALRRIAQANFDTALDVRYAIARNILWATYIHPLSELHDRQFLAAIGQTVNAAKSYGVTYSSGLLSYGGGDSGDLLQRQLIDELLKQGEDI